MLTEIYIRFSVKNSHRETRQIGSATLSDWKQMTYLAEGEGFGPTRIAIFLMIQRKLADRNARLAQMPWSRYKTGTVNSTPAAAVRVQLANRPISRRLRRASQHGRTNLLHPPNDTGVPRRRILVPLSNKIEMDASLASFTPELEDGSVQCD